MQYPTTFRLMRFFWVMWKIFNWLWFLLTRYFKGWSDPFWDRYLQIWKKVRPEVSASGLFFLGQTKAGGHPKATQSVPILLLLLVVFKIESVGVAHSSQKNSMQALRIDLLCVPELFQRAGVLLWFLPVWRQKEESSGSSASVSANRRRPRNPPQCGAHAKNKKKWKNRGWPMFNTGIVPW